MANVITAGNSTNGGTAITTDTSGTLEIKTGTGSGTTAISIDASQNVTIAGTISASGGVSGGIRSGTAVASTSGTSIDFTSLPTGIKRITVIFSGISTNGTSNYLIQAGSGSITTTGYLGAVGTNAGTTNNFSTGFIIYNNVVAADNFVGSIVLTLISGNTWIESGIFYSQSSTRAGATSSGSIALSGALDRIRITTVNGTDTFDAGSINILFE